MHSFSDSTGRLPIDKRERIVNTITWCKLTETMGVTCINKGEYTCTEHHFKVYNLRPSKTNKNYSENMTTYLFCLLKSAQSLYRGMTSYITVIVIK